MLSNKEIICPFNLLDVAHKKKDIPAGLWYKTPTGKVIETKELAENMYVSTYLVWRLLGRLMLG